MNKAQLIEELAGRFDGNRKQAAAALDAVVDVVTTSVAAGERVAVSGLGVFERAERAARTARNPQTGEKVRVKKTVVPRFKAAQGFKDVVANPKSRRKPAATAAAAARVPAPRTSGAAATAAKAPASKPTKPPVTKAIKAPATKAPATKATARKRATAKA